MRTPKGYSMFMVVTLLALLALCLGAMMAVIATSGRASGESVSRRRSFYGCDGVSRAVVKLAQEFIAERPAGVTLQDFVCSRGGGCPALPTLMPAGMEAVGFVVEEGAESTGIIPSGPFEGMQSALTPVRFELRAESASGQVCEVQQTVTLGRIAMFQFFVFSDGFAEWNPGPSMDARGRTHVNGDLCLSSGARFRLQRVTASGRVLHGKGNSVCPVDDGLTGSPWVLQDGQAFPDDTSTAAFAQIGQDNDHGCNNCDGTPLDWREYAVSIWGNNLQDSAHGVPALRLPITSSVTAQPGRDARGDIYSNDENSRLLIDPVRAGEPTETSAQKFACKADIRIINGVWYLKDPMNVSSSNPCDWPGTPIWSDHPGTFPGTTFTPDEFGVGTNNQVVGQGDLRTQHSWASTPHRYSYYRTDPSSSTDSRMLDPPMTTTTPSLPTSPPVISYGALLRRSGDQWVPGHWVDGDTDLRNSVCGTHDSSGRQDAFFDAFDPGDGMCGTTGTQPTDRPLAPRLLNAARSGFYDPHTRTMSGDAEGDTDADLRAKRSNMLPINFDVAAFIEALGDTGTGELGSYFQSRDFNGIVYITSTWLGALGGAFAAGTMPTLWPDNGTRPGTVTQPPGASVSQAPEVNSTRSHAALPYPLCAAPDSPAPFQPGELLTSGSDAGASGDDFRIPDCSNANIAYPNAVRVIHGQDLLHPELPEGLTIATNLPMYLLGDMNSTSNVDPASTDWRPLLVAGDQVNYLSEAFTDQNMTWFDAHSFSNKVPVALETTYNLAVLAGLAVGGTGSSPIGYSGGLHNFVRYIENWGGVSHNVNGSIVAGFASVYNRWPRGSPNGTTYRAPNRNWAFDGHFADLRNQPPGAPLYDVAAIQSWER